MGLLRELCDLDKVEEWLQQELKKVSLIGELPLEEEDFRRLCTMARTERLRVKSATWVTLFVLCARHADECENGFWDGFRASVRGSVARDAGFDSSCRERYKESRNRLETLLPHLKFPREPHVCVTSVYYHAVIPKRFEDGFARWVATLDREEVNPRMRRERRVGWGAIAALGVATLAEVLTEGVSNLQVTQLRRFLQNEESARAAASLLKTLCEFADKCWAEGAYTSDSITDLLADNQLLCKLWLKLKDEVVRDRGVTQASQSAWRDPKWVWDVKGRELRLSFPRQRVRGTEGRPRPSAYRFETKAYHPDVWQDGRFWFVEPHELSDVRQVDSVSLVNDEGQAIQSWSVPAIPNEPWLFFKPSPDRTKGVLVEATESIQPGEWFLVLREGAVLVANNCAVEPFEKFPIPFELQDRVMAGRFQLNPPVTLRFVDREISLTADIVGEVPFQLVGDQAAGLDSATPVYLGSAPTMRALDIDESEVGFLRVWWEKGKGQLHGAEKVSRLLQHYQATIAGRELTIPLASVLPAGGGRFEVSLRRGATPALYAPAEFVLAPLFEVSPPDSLVLYSDENQPTAEILSDEIREVSVGGSTVPPLEPGYWKVKWGSTCDACNVSLRFDDFVLPLQWKVWWFSAGVKQTVVAQLRGSEKWTPEEFRERREWLLFASGRPDQMVSVQVGNRFRRDDYKFDRLGVFSRSLTEFSDALRESEEDDVCLAVETEGHSRVALRVRRINLLIGGKDLFGSFAQFEQLPKCVVRGITVERLDGIRLGVSCAGAPPKLYVMSRMPPPVAGWSEEDFIVDLSSPALTLSGGNYAVWLELQDREIICGPVQFSVRT